MGEISFCAYNTRVGWRNIIEKIKANATTAARPPDGGTDAGKSLQPTMAR